MKQDQGVGIIFNQRDGGMEMMAQEKFGYTNGWDNLTEDVDNLLVHLEKQTNAKLNDTIFFFYSNVIDGKTGEIKTDYFKSVKSLVKNLELVPLGYIEVSDAVLALLQKKEGASLNCILLELDKADCSLFIVKNGKKTLNRTIGRSDNLIDDLTLCFNQLKAEVALPARLILYNSVNLEKEAALIVSHRWSSSVFVQLPRVEIVADADVFAGLSLVFSEQIQARQPAVALAETQEGTNKLGFVIGGDVGTAPPPILPEKPARHWSWPRLPRLAIRPGGSWLYLTGIGLIAAMLFLIEWFVHTATVTVFFPTRAINQDVSYASDANGGVLPVQTKSLTIPASQTKITNGTKAIGNKAKGEVTVYNFDDQEKTFTKGTTLSNNNLQFSLDDNVTVPAVTITYTSSNDQVRSPGKAKVNVTALDIGAEGNLAKGTRFSIGDYSASLYFAINETGLSGGSKKEVRTVAKQDLNELETAVLDKAKKDYPAKLKTSANTNEIIIDPLTEIKLAQTNYSKELGEEADSVSLTAKVVVTYYYVDKTAFFSFLQSQLKDTIGSGYHLSSQTVHPRIKQAEKNSDVITIDWSISGNAVKEVDAASLKPRLLGKSRGQLESLLKNDYQATGFTLSIRPDAPPLNLFTPWRSSNVKLVINSLN